MKFVFCGLILFQDMFLRAACPYLYIYLCHFVFPSSSCLRLRMLVLDPFVTSTITKSILNSLVVFYSSAPFVLFHCSRCILFWCPLQHLFFHANFQVLMFFCFGRMQLSLRTYFLSLLLIFARLSTVFVSTPYCIFFSFLHAITFLAPKSPGPLSKSFFKRGQQDFE